MQNRFISSLAKALYAASRDATKASAVKDIAARAIAMLAAKRQLRNAPQLLLELDRVRKEAEGRISVYVVSARPLSASARAAIRDFIARKTGKEVELETSVDEGVLGGFSIRWGDTLIDATLIRSIKELQRLVTI